MLGAVREWRRSRRQRYLEDRHDRGFGWAMARMVRHGEPPEYVEDCVNGGAERNGPDPFDEGAREAIRLYERRGA